MKIAVTGANGTVGRALLSRLDSKKFEVTPLDRPDHDVRVLDDLVSATRDHDALVHFAWDARWDNDTSGKINPDNTLMTYNVYEAAAINGIPKVLMGSSNHAHRHGRKFRDTDGMIRASIPPVPDSPYGAQKVFMESLGLYYTTITDSKLDVLCVRIGNVNANNEPNADTPPRWLSYRDLGGLVTAFLTKEHQPGHHEVVYGVSKQTVFDTRNSFGWEPQDSAIITAGHMGTQ